MNQKFTGPTFAPDILARQLQLRQQAEYAKQMREEGSQMPEGQMVSGHFVAPSITQYLAQGLKSYMGGRAQADLPEKLSALQDDMQEAQLSQFGLESSPQALAAGLDPDMVSKSYPVDTQGGQASQGPQPMTLPGMTVEQSRMALMNLGPQKYMELLAEGAAPTSLERNLNTAGLQPGTPEYQQFARDSIVAPYRGTTAMQNVQAMGLKPGTPEYAAAIDRLSGPASTTVNVGAGERAWDTESAKLFAKRYDDITTQAGAASQMMALLDMAESGLQTGVRTGALGEAEQSIRQLGLAMGIGDADKIAGGELVRAVQNRMALIMRSPDSGMGMPGSVSDKDLSFLKDSQIGLDRSPEGNQKMLAAFRALERRKLEIAQLADQYIQQNGRLDVGFNQLVRQHAEQNPMFAPTSPEERMSTLDDILGF